MDRSVTLMVWWVSGLLLYAFEVYWFIQWWGFFGGLIGFFVPPITIVFPFIYLAKEGFSFFFFTTWAVGILALIISSSQKTSRIHDFDNSDEDDLD